MCDWLFFTLNLNIVTTKIIQLAAELHGWQQSLYSSFFVPKHVILDRLIPSKSRRSFPLIRSYSERCQRGLALLYKEQRYILWSNTDCTHVSARAMALYSTSRSPTELRASCGQNPRRAYPCTAAGAAQGSRKCAVPREWVRDVSLRKRRCAPHEQSD